MLCVSCSSARALQHRGRKEAHAGQSDSARPSTAGPMPGLRVAKPKPGPLEVLDPDTSDEPDGSDLPPEYAVLDLTVPRTALVSCANCPACGASGSMPRSRVLLYLTRVARLRGRVTWLLLSWMVSWRCFLCLSLENREDDLLCSLQFAGGQPRHIATSSTSVARSPIALDRHWLTPSLHTHEDTEKETDTDTPTHTHTHTHPVRAPCVDNVSAPFDSPAVCLFDGE